MDAQVTRRDFIKTTGIAAGVAVAAGYSPFSYAQNEQIRVAVIGTGGQGYFHIRVGLPGGKQFQIVAVCDVYAPNLNSAWAEVVKDYDPKRSDEKKKNVKMYMDYREMLEKEKFEAVVIATPLHTHFQIALDCLDAGKYVFCEKMLAYDIEQCRKLVTKCHDTGLFIQVGHERRYAPDYNRALWLTRKSDVVGRISHITAQWHRNSDWRRPVDPNYKLTPEETKWIPNLEKHINWRLYDEFTAGSLMTELASQQLDVCNWFLHTPPSRVTGLGGLDYWKDGRDTYDNVSLTYEYDVRPPNPGFATLTKRNPYMDLNEINRPYTVRVAYTALGSNAKRGASELLQGDRGSLELSYSACFGYTETAARDASNSVSNSVTASRSPYGYVAQPVSNPGEDKEQLYMKERKTAEQLQFESFYNDIYQKKTPKANQMVGLLAAVAALSGSKAMRERATVTIDPALCEFDFETPDPYRYDNFAPADSKWREYSGEQVTPERG